MPRSLNLLGIDINYWKREELLKEVKKKIERDEDLHLVSVDLHKFMQLMRDFTTFEDIRNSDIIFLEGLTLSLATKIFQSTKLEGVIESFLIPELIQYARKKDYRILILGSDRVSEMGNKIYKAYPDSDIEVLSYKKFEKDKDDFFSSNGSKPLFILGEVSDIKEDVKLKDFLKNDNVRMVHGFGRLYDLLANGHNGKDSLNLLKKLFHKPLWFWFKHFYSILEFFLLLFVGVIEEILIPYEFLAIEQDRGHDLYRLGKRMIDLLVSSLILIVGAPLYVIIAILIKLDSKGPVFFTQERAGYKGKRFTILKFRTMRSDVPKYDNSPNCNEDSRLTTVGKCLRKTSLDEIPQFINVLKGDMSVVGPRPEMPFKVNNYTEEEKKRLKVKPGVTGLWQLYGDRSKPIHEAIEYDLEYIKNRSTWLDFKIIILSFIHILLTPFKSESEWKQW